MGMVVFRGVASMVYFLGEFRIFPKPFLINIYVSSFYIPGKHLLRLDQCFF